LNANSELVCATCHECMFDAIHDLCVSGYLNDVNARVKPKSVKSRSAKSKMKKMWKPIGKVYTTIRYSWKPTGRTFTIVGNTCPLTRIISTNVVPPRKSILATPLGNVTISLVYYVEGLGYNLFFVGKSNKSSHKPKADDTNQEKLHLLHMDLCGPMRVESINGKKYIMVIVDDYSRFTWVKFLRTKDEAPEAESVNTTCYTQNRSLIRLRYNKIPEDLGKLNAKADIGIFVGYAPAKKAFRIYKKRTRLIMETIHVTFDELTMMASE
ncbi:retrovirus-related pol polyprotein from transposon TNT 1-94, partial [Tanacetum coccineum]